jgi:hypothetical protein
MNVISMPLIILRIANAMIRKPALPNFLRTKCQSKRARISSFDQLKSTLQRDIAARSQEQM